MIKSIKQVIRIFQEFLERYVLGGYFQKIIWRYGLVYRKNWPNGYQETVDTPHYHRKVIVDVIKKLKVNSICEVACGNGFNLIQLRKELPKSYLIGIDINNKGIESIKKYFKNDNSSHFTIASADDLKMIDDNSVDVVFCDALLMLITPNKINKVMRELIRISKKNIVFNEYSKEGAIDGFFNGGRWIYDLPSLLHKHHPQVEMVINNSPIQEKGAWLNYGKLIVAELKK